MLGFSREDTLFIITEDTAVDLSDSSTIKNLIKRWFVQTKKTLEEKHDFQITPKMEKINEFNYIITNRKNNKINISFILIPINLEHQVAKIHMKKNDLKISNTDQNNSHGFLDSIAKRLGKDNEALIKSSVELLKSEKWVIKVENIIKRFLERDFDDVES